MRIRYALKNPYFVLSVLYAYFIVFAFIVDSPKNIFHGLATIIQSKDILITDYIEIAGIGASLVNSAVINIIFILYFFKRIKPSGSIIMVFWLFSGFSFFGKNLFNIWPVIFGGFLYSKFRRECFSKYYIVTMLATSLSPAVSQIAFDEGLPMPVGLFTGIALGIFIGFIMSPISDNALHSHQGYNLYNVGFASGIVAILLRIILQTLGFDIEPVFYWSAGSPVVLRVFLISIFIFLISIGLLCGQNNKANFIEISKQPGRLGSDFFSKYGASCYINMGVLGLFSTMLVLVTGGDLNGPVMGGIFTVAGFGCFGKHLKNTIPIMVGCLLGGGFLHIGNQNPAAVLAVLFSTCLAPIPGAFGWWWGVIAGFLHFNISINIGDFSAGMNLYNNGLAGGLVTMFLLPLIETLRKKA